MIAAGLGLTLAGIAFWHWLQGTPEYVAVRAADILVADPGGVVGLPLQKDDLAGMGISAEQGAAALKKLKDRFLPEARIVSSGKYLVQPGKNGYLFKVEVSPGTVIDATLPVIDDNGKGVIQFGDLVMVYRSLISRSGGSGTALERAKLDEASRILVESGIKGYYDLSHNQIEPWPTYGPSADPVARL